MRSQDAVIRVYDEAGDVIETHEHAGDFKGWWVFTRITSHLLLKGIFRPNPSLRASSSKEIIPEAIL
jgi:hypothetical protein